MVDSLTNPTQVLAARRSRPADLKGRWEFPGGKVKTGETPETALEREIREELGVEIRVGTELDTWPINEHLELRLFLAEIVDGDLTPGETHDAVRWLASMSWLCEWLPDRRAGVVDSDRGPTSGRGR